MLHVLGADRNQIKSEMVQDKPKILNILSTQTVSPLCVGFYIGAILGIVPNANEVFFKPAATFRVFYDTAVSLGFFGIVLMQLFVGHSLYSSKGIKTLSTTKWYKMSVAVFRLVVLPACGVALLVCAHLIFDLDEAIGVTVLLLFIMPSNMTIHEICRMLKRA
jgi:hypothetical protein